MAYREDVDSQLILTIGAVSGFMVIVAVIGLQAWYMSEERRELEQYSNTANPQLVELRKAEQANLTSYRWINKDKQIAAVPIDDAMKLLIQNKGKVPSTQPK